MAFRSALKRVAAVITREAAPCASHAGRYRQAMGSGRVGRWTASARLGDESGVSLSRSFASAKPCECPHRTLAPSAARVRPWVVELYNIPARLE
jgi:hypothetical protein